MKRGKTRSALKIGPTHRETNKTKAKAREAARAQAATDLMAWAPKETRR